MRVFDPPAVSSGPPQQNWTIRMANGIKFARPSASQEDQTPTGSSLLTAEDLVKKFRQGTETVTALNGVSLEIASGQFIAIMGASGCDKSTLLHVMAGLTQPDEGTVSVEGEHLSGMSDTRLTDFRRRRIGLVFQQFNLVTTLTALENVMLPLLAEGGVRRTRSVNGEWPCSRRWAWSSGRITARMP